MVEALVVEALRVVKLAKFPKILVIFADKIETASDIKLLTNKLVDVAEVKVAATEVKLLKLGSFVKE